MNYSGYKQIEHQLDQLAEKELGAEKYEEFKTESDFVVDLSKRYPIIR